jgi:hypothetical protein
VGTLVSSLVDFATPATGLNNVTDPDVSPLLGIAVSGINTTNGTWFFSTTAVPSWTPLASASENAALLLAADANTRIYFQPTANFNGTIGSALTFHAWDQSSGTEGGTVNLTVTGTGGQTAFSTAIDTASITVNAVNDAPVVVNTTTSTLAAVDSSNAVATPQTTTVATLISNAAITDPFDTAPLSGIAITGITGPGTWAFSTTLVGGQYTTITAPSDGSAVLLASSAFVRYTPANNETDNATITYRAWDQTSGTNGATGVSTLVNGGTTAFSTATSVATHAVAPVNDAPVLATAPSPVLAVVAEDALAPSGAVGTLVSSLVDFAAPATGLNNVTDPDVSPKLGIAVTSIDTTNGIWFYSINDGVTTTVSVAARRLRDRCRIRARLIATRRNHGRTGRSVAGASNRRHNSRSVASAARPSAMEGAPCSSTPSRADQPARPWISRNRHIANSCEPDRPYRYLLVRGPGSRLGGHRARGRFPDAASSAGVARRGTVSRQPGAGRGGRTPRPCSASRTWTTARPAPWTAG